MNNGLHSIERFAFSECKELKQVSIPDSVLAIGDHAFSGCELLETIQLPSGMDTIEEATFTGCYKLSGITIPASVKTIKAYAFSECYALAKLNLLGGEIAIEENVFELENDMEKYGNIEISFPENTTTSKNCMLRFENIPKIKLVPVAATAATGAAIAA